MAADKSDLLQGTLDMLVLKIVALEPVHGYGIAQRIQQISRDVLQVQQGSLYPALQRMLKEGWLEAETGVDALRVVEEADGKIDLIVSDVIMPEMDGPTMLMELRKRGVAAKVVFVSGYADDAFARNLPEGLEFQFLPKPFTLKQLIETVKGAMN